MRSDLPRRLAAEGMGAALLVATVVGSGIMAERLAAGNQALALFGNTLPTGAMLVVLITTLGPVSGAHFNPAVTLAFAIRREMTWREAAAYALGQLAGAVVGVWMAHLMFGAPVFEFGRNERHGGGLWLAEAIATFGLVLSILATRRSRPQMVPLVVGLYITAAYWFTASTSFANPAVTLARALTASFSGIRPVDAPMFILAQLAGALVAVGFGGWLLSTPEPVPARKA